MSEKFNMELVNPATNEREETIMTNTTNATNNTFANGYKGFVDEYRALNRAFRLDALEEVRRWHSNVKNLAKTGTGNLTYWTNVVFEYTKAVSEQRLMELEIEFPIYDRGDAIAYLEEARGELIRNPQKVALDVCFNLLDRLDTLEIETGEYSPVLLYTLFNQKEDDKLEAHRKLVSALENAITGLEHPVDTIDEEAGAATAAPITAPAEDGAEAQEPVEKALALTFDNARAFLKGALGGDLAPAYGLKASDKETGACKDVLNDSYMLARNIIAQGYTTVYLDMAHQEEAGCLFMRAFSEAIKRTGAVVDVRIRYNQGVKLDAMEKVADNLIAQKAWNGTIRKLYHIAPTGDKFKELKVTLGNVWDDRVGKNVPVGNYINSYKAHNALYPTDALVRALTPVVSRTYLERCAKGREYDTAPVGTPRHGYVPLVVKGR